MCAGLRVAPACRAECARFRGYLAAGVWLPCVRRRKWQGCTFLRSRSLCPASASSPEHPDQAIHRRRSTDSSTIHSRAQELEDLNFPKRPKVVSSGTNVHGNSQYETPDPR